MKVTVGFDPRDPEHLQLYVPDHADFEGDRYQTLAIAVPVDEARQLSQQIGLLMLVVDAHRKAESS